jgi:hypothetical protein
MAIINKLLPYIDDKDNGYLLKSLTDLNHLYYYAKIIPDDIKHIPRDEVLSKYFKYGNMGVGLIKNTDNNLFQPNGDKIMYKIIHHNFMTYTKCNINRFVSYKLAIFELTE